MTEESGGPGRETTPVPPGLPATREEAQRRASGRLPDATRLVRKPGATRLLTASPSPATSPVTTDPMPWTPGAAGAATGVHDRGSRLGQARAAAVRSGAMAIRRSGHST